MMKINKETIQKINTLFQAISEGKTIQINKGDVWTDVGIDAKEMNISAIIQFSELYRIKPEPKYRPFKNAEECWQEMLNHQPFGWVKTDSGYVTICHVNEGDDFNATFKDITFADGTPFGIKEEK